MLSIYSTASRRERGRGLNKPFRMSEMNVDKPRYIAILNQQSPGHRADEASNSTSNRSPLSASPPLSWSFGGRMSKTLASERNVFPLIAL